MSSNVPAVLKEQLPAVIEPRGTASDRQYAQLRLSARRLQVSSPREAFNTERAVSSPIGAKTSREAELAAGKATLAMMFRAAVVVGLGALGAVAVMEIGSMGRDAAEQQRAEHEQYSNAVRKYNAGIRAEQAERRKYKPQLATWK